MGYIYIEMYIHMQVCISIDLHIEIKFCLSMGVSIHILMCIYIPMGMCIHTETYRDVDAD